MEKIKKVILVDTEGKERVLEIENYKTREELEYRHQYESQFIEISKDVLGHISQHLIQDYAEWYLDMIESDDCDCDEKQIDEFDDDELVTEYYSRFNNSNISLTQKHLSELCQQIISSNNYRYEEKLKNLIEEIG